MGFCKINQTTNDYFPDDYISELHKRIAEGFRIITSDKLQTISCRDQVLKIPIEVSEEVV